MHSLSPQHPVMLGQCQGGLGLSLSSIGMTANPTLGSNMLSAQNANGIRGSISRMNVIAGTGEMIFVKNRTSINSLRNHHFFLDMCVSFTK